MTIQEALGRLLDGHALSRDEARKVMDTIMSGEATPAQIGGFLVALRIKGETADEIAGCAEAMRAHVLAVRPRRDDLVDTAGTGGDGGQTFNISTAADGEVMAVRHPELPIDGVQFHPESVLTPVGQDLARNFLEGVR